MDAVRLLIFAILVTSLVLVTMRLATGELMLTNAERKILRRVDALAVAAAVVTFVLAWGGWI